MYAYIVKWFNEANAHIYHLTYLSLFFFLGENIEDLLLVIFTTTI